MAFADLGSTVRGRASCGCLARLFLRRFRESDVEAFARYRSDPAVARYQGWDAPYPIEQAKEFVTTMATAQADVPGDWLQIAVARTGDGSLVGDVRWLHRRTRRGPSRSGSPSLPSIKDAATREAVSLLLRYLFGQPGTPRRHFLCCSTSCVPPCSRSWDVFQFSPGVRRRWPGWHRRAGRVLVVAGLGWRCRRCGSTSSSHGQTPRVRCCIRSGWCSGPRCWSPSSSGSPRLVVETSLVIGRG